MPRADELIEAGWQARQIGRHVEAERDLLEAIAASRAAGARPTLIRALKALAHVLRDLDQADRALPLYEEAVALGRDEGDVLLLAHTLRHLGDLHRDAGRLDDATPLYEEALGLYRSAPDVPPLDLANALRAMALAKQAKGDSELADRLLGEARRLYRAALP